MKKVLCVVFSVLMTLALIGLVGCKDKEPKPKGLQITEAPPSITAELGEKCVIPTVTASKDGAEIEVIVKVVDSANVAVELLGRGTRFFANDLKGYTITYSATDGVTTLNATTSVAVTDNKGPSIILPASAETLTAKKDSIVEIPVPTVTDASGVVSSVTTSVKFGETDVAIIKGVDGGADTFTVGNYGVYKIIYTAKDASGNENSKNAFVTCSRIVELCNFDDDLNVWASGMELVTEHAVSGKAIKVSVTGATYYGLLAVYPKYYDLSAFDKIELSVYVDKDMNTSNEGIYLLNQKYKLAEGNNVVTIDKNTFNSQYPDGKIPSSLVGYETAGYLWFQLNANPGTFYIDNLVGVFDNYEVDEKAPVIDFGRTLLTDTISIKQGNTITVPNVTVYDNSMEDITASYIVKNKANEDITAGVKDGSYVINSIDEKYTITYTAKDSANNSSSKVINITVAEPDPIPTEPDFPEGREYDILQNFDTGLESSVSTGLCSGEYNTTAHAVSGKSIKIGTTNAAWAAILINLKKNGVVLTQADFEAYDYFQITIYSEGAGASFYLLNKAYPLKSGVNKVLITKADMLEQLKADNCYRWADGWFFCQSTSDGAVNYTLYLDNFIGVYADGYVKPDPSIPEGREYDVLQNFDTGLESSVSTTLCSGEYNTTAHAVGGKSIKIGTTNAAWAAILINLKKNGVVLTQADFEAYDYFQITIYSEEAGASFYLLNKGYALSKGLNIVRIEKADMLEQLKADNCYRWADGWFFCQSTSDGAVNYTLYLDNFIGVYATKPAA